MSRPLASSRTAKSWVRWALVAGAITGIVSTVLVLLMMPIISQGGGGRATDQARFKDLVSACANYALDNDGRMPDSLQMLYPTYMPELEWFSCQTDQRKPGDMDPDAIDAWSSYALVPGLHETMPEDFILLYDRSPANRDGKGRCVAFLNNAVEWWPAEREPEFQQRLAEQLAKMKDWKPAAVQPQMDTDEHR